MVAETLAKRFRQQVMKKKEKCIKGNETHYKICIAQLLCDGGSFHIQHHLRPLPELERRWGRRFSTALASPTQAPIRQRDLLATLAASRTSEKASALLVFYVSSAASVFWVIFLLSLLEPSINVGTACFCKAGLLSTLLTAGGGWETHMLQAWECEQVKKPGLHIWEGMCERNTQQSGPWTDIFWDWQHHNQNAG